MRIPALLITTVIFLGGCASPPGPAVQFCENDSYQIDAAFEGGNFFSCSINRSGIATLTIRPEDKPPINESPWYAFRVEPSGPGGVTVTLNFVDGYARYWPKISADGVKWRPMDESRVSRSDDGNSITLQLDLDEESVWVAGQPLLTTAYYDKWLQVLEANDAVETSVLGHSVEGRAIGVAKTASKPEVVILIGRQHPPEVTGALAMKPFVESVLGNSSLARRFRDRYMVVIIPLLNPDGVVLGHWRHNVNGVDLNRDWGPFTQPETQGAERLLADLEQAGIKVRLMLDFHSTKSNKFYTQLRDDGTAPEHFATNWLSSARQRLPDFEFEHDARKQSAQANTKNYFFKRYGIPAITYELGDETDPEQIAATSPIFAEEMMRVMLEYEPD